MSKISVIYEVSLTGEGRNFFTLYRHRFGNGFGNSTFIKNLSTDFDEAIVKARLISGDDEDSETYSKILLSDPDEVEKIIRLVSSKIQAESDGIITFGKYKHRILTEVFVEDKKYIEWIAKGGFVKNDEYWNETISNDRHVRQQSIALLIGSGDWIERNGIFMPVNRAVKLDFIESLTTDKTITDKQRIDRVLRLIGKVYRNDGAWGVTVSFKMLDENNNLYIANNVSSFPFEEESENAWYKFKFTAHLYNGKVFMKRILPPVGGNLSEIKTSALA